MSKHKRTRKKDEERGIKGKRAKQEHKREEAQRLANVDRCQALDEAWHSNGKPKTPTKCDNKSVAHSFFGIKIRLCAGHEQRCYHFQRNNGIRFHSYKELQDFFGTLKPLMKYRKRTKQAVDGKNPEFKIKDKMKDMPKDSLF